MTKRYTVTATGAGGSRTTDLDSRGLTLMCVNLTGGGHTESQTAAAIEMQGRLTDGESVTVGPYTVSIQENAQ